MILRILTAAVLCTSTFVACQSSESDPDLRLRDHYILSSFTVEDMAELLQRPGELRLDSRELRFMQNGGQVHAGDTGRAYAATKSPGVLVKIGLCLHEESIDPRANLLTTISADGNFTEIALSSDRSALLFDVARAGHGGTALFRTAVCTSPGKRQRLWLQIFENRSDPTLSREQVSNLFVALERKLRERPAE